MISFIAFHGNPDRQLQLLARIDESYGDFGSLLAFLAGGPADLALAYRETGFPAPLLGLADAISKRLPPGEAPAFARQLVSSATIESDVGEVAGNTIRQIFTSSLDLHGRSKMLAAARENEALAEAARILEPSLPRSRREAKAISRSTQRRGCPSPDGDVRYADALVVWVERNASAGSPEALGWLASLERDPVAFYRRCGVRLIDHLSAA